jgi:cysteine desulfurase / selenocysteine lyase
MPDTKINYLEDRFDWVREQFTLLDHWNFFNVADQALPGQYWLKAVRQFYDFQEAGCTEAAMSKHDIATHPFLMEATFDTVARSAKLIGADKDETCLMYRPLQAANLICNDILPDIQPWKKGQNVVFTDICYPSGPYVFMNLRDRYGIELRCVKNVNGEILMEDLEKAIDENTRLVNINRTTAFCGFTFNVKEICKMAHKYGAYVIDDACQALGVIDIDVHDDDLDFLTSCSYKWQNGPEGAGVFYAKKEITEKANPIYRNYLAVEMPEGIPISLPNHDNIKSWNHPQRAEISKFNQDVVIGPAVFGWQASVKFIEKLGIKNIEKRVRMLGQYAVNGLKEIKGLEFKSPTEPNKMHGIITYSTGSYDRDVKCWNKFMYPDLGIKPTKISIRSLGGVGGIRFSTHYYNTTEEIDQYVAQQAEMLYKIKK